MKRCRELKASLEILNERKGTENVATAAAEADAPAAEGEAPAEGEPPAAAAAALGLPGGTPIVPGATITAAAAAEEGTAGGLVAAQRAYVAVVASRGGIDGAEVPRSGREVYVALHRCYKTTNLQLPQDS
jgi:hypothetical protein|eukprot:COSAG06_NODE_29483_length_555_cov_1.392544_1_plen_130_part_00